MDNPAMVVSIAAKEATSNGIRNSLASLPLFSNTM
jgi:hypothetical protein